MSMTAKQRSLEKEATRIIESGSVRKRKNKRYRKLEVEPKTIRKNPNTNDYSKIVDKYESLHSANRSTSQQKRRRAKALNTQSLIEKEITFTSHNNGLHLKVESTSRGRIDYWPSTDRWIVASDGFECFGVDELIKHINSAPD